MTAHDDPPAAGRSAALLAPLERFGIRPGLDRVRRLLAALGDPHLAYPTVLVAGTNGKGSTAVLLASIATRAGTRTGLLTSPHLETFAERVAIDGRPILDRELAHHLQTALDRADAEGQDPPTVFEALTVAAALVFREREVELGILEVGLGGRLDATNVSDPGLSLVTSIGRDHEEYLGGDLESIAREKAGIFRRGRPAIVGAVDPDVETVLRHEAQKRGAELVLARELAQIEPFSAPGAAPQRLRLATPEDDYRLELALPGRHQLRNLALAVVAAETLAARGFPSIDAAAIRAGVRACRWPGRLERVELDGDRTVLLDAAHNAAGIETLATHLETLSERYDLLFGALTEKTLDPALPRLAAATGRVVLTRPPVDRGADPERWARHFPRPHLEPDPDAALDAALARSPRLLVCGSLYLVGRVRELLRDRFGVPAPVTEVGYF